MAQTEELSETDLRAIRDRRKLFIGGLSFKTTDPDLQNAFSRFGAVESGMAMATSSI